jgi:DNA modification methylase
MITLLTGDCREVLKTRPSASVHCCITSPPYWGLRSYGMGADSGELGLEATPQEYVNNMVAVCKEVKRVLRADGTLWLNLGDSYAGGGRGSGYSDKQDSNGGTVGMPPSIIPTGCKPKDLVGIPWMVAVALRADGWYLRQDIIWAKPNPMPESVTDRCTKSHEHVFLLSISSKYYYDAAAIQEPAAYDGRKDTVMHGGKKDPAGYTGVGAEQSMQTNGHERWQLDKDGNRVRNKRDVWTVPTFPYKGSHFATFPPALIRPMVLAGCPQGGTILDPFGGSGTTGEVAESEGRNAILIDLNPANLELQKARTAQRGLFTL